MGVNSLLLMQATYYATQSLGLSVGLVGTLFLVSKVFDGVTDLIAGYIIDKTHTRLGKARPYELFLIPTWILTVIFFSTPMALGTTGKAVWVFVLYVLIQAVCVTFLNISFCGKFNRNNSGCFHDSDDRKYVYDSMHGLWRMEDGG